MIKPELPDHSVFNRQLGAAVMFILAVFAALFFFTISLPHNRYIRLQQLEHTVVGRSRWDYKRIHFDPTPINVAVVGDSRTKAAMSAPALESALTTALSQPVHVANLSTPQTGRNLDVVTAKEVLTNRPELKILLLAISEPSVWSQPAFMQLADTPDIFTSAVFVNYWYLEDLSALPYRSIKLFIDGLAPALGRFAGSFDARHYQGTHYDTSRSFTESDSVFINRNKMVSAAELNRIIANQPKPKVTFGHRLFGSHENVIEYGFDQRIARLAASRGVELLFVHIPTWHEQTPGFDMAQFAKVAPVLAAPDTIAARPEDFTDAEHLSVRGIRQVSAWIAPALHPFLGPLLPTRHNPPLPDDGRITVSQGASQ